MDSATLDKANELKKQITRHNEMLQAMDTADIVNRQMRYEIPLGVIQHQGYHKWVHLDNQIGKTLYKMIEQAIRTKKQALEEELDAL